jgi:dipeptidyl aminopeptidase/acylaminoacyl peptidase
VTPLAATAAAETQPLYSPDGQWIALTLSDDPPRWAFSHTIHLIPAAGGVPRPLAPTYDGAPVLIGWAAEGKRLLFSEARGTTTRLYALDVETNVITEISQGGGVYYEFHLNRGRTLLGFTWQAADRPTEAFVSPMGDFAPVQVSRANADLPPCPFGQTEVIRWTSTEGLEIEGLLTVPVGYEPGQRVPLLLEIHGGPWAFTRSRSSPTPRSTLSRRSRRTGSRCSAPTPGAPPATARSSGRPTRRTGAEETIGT